MIPLGYKWAPTVLIVLAIAGSAFAQQNQLGIFFDEQGQTTEATTTTPYGVVNAWVQLVNPATSDNIRGCEFRFEVFTDGPDPILVWELPEQALNLLESPSFMIGYGSPLPSAERVTLAQATIVIPQAEQAVWLSVHPVEQPSLLDPPGFGYPVCHPAYSYGPDHAMAAMTPISGCESLPLAVINNNNQPPQLEMDQLPELIVIGEAWNGEPLQPLTIHNHGPISYSGVVRCVGETPVPLSVNRHFMTNDPVDFQVPVGGSVTIAVGPSVEGFDSSTLELEVCGAVWNVEVGTSCAWSEEALDFGEIPVGAEAMQTVQLTNVGVVPFYDDEIINIGYFHLEVVGYHYEVEPGETITYRAYFRPQAEGEFEDFVQPTGPYCTLNLRGRAVDMPPECEISQSEIVFPELVVGANPDSRYFTIKNIGGGLLEGDLTFADGTEDFYFYGGQTSIPVSLGYNQLAHFNVFFDPETEGEHHTNIVLGEICGPLPVSGVAIDPGPECQIISSQLEDGVLTLDPIPIGGRRTTYLEIRNSGGGELVLNPTLADTTGVFQYMLWNGQPLSHSEHSYLYIEHLPQSVGQDTTILHLGTGCDPVVVVGTGTEPYASCYGYPYRTHVGRVPAGVTTYSYFYIRNNGYMDLQGNLSVQGDGFYLVNPGPFELPLQESMYDVLLFDPPEEGEFETVVSTGLSPCPGNWTFTGRSVPAGSDRIGFYTDLEGTNNHFDPTFDGEGATVYVVLHQPSAEGPLRSWYVNYWRSGPVWVDRYWSPRVPGNLVSSSYSQRFYASEPMPLEEHMVLATFSVVATDALEPALVRLGYGNYSFEGDDVPETIVLYNSDDLLVNADKSYFEALPAPPVAEPGNEGVLLNWPVALMDVEGFHVYRRLQDGPPEKLNEEPVIGLDGEATFLDITLPDGSIEATYYVTALKFGEEGLPGGETLLRIVEIDPEVEVPPAGQTRLLPNYPNPFNPETCLPFELGQAGRVRIQIYNLAGRLVLDLVNEDYPVGRHEVIWNGRDASGRALPSNVYYAKLQMGGIVQLQKLTLLK